jgi:hypothetical protein
MSGFLNITVPECEIKGSYASKYILYTINTAPLGLSVQRKFADFNWLRTLLMKRYIGMHIPPIPAKLVSPPSKSVAAGRRRLFACFLRHIGIHDVLRFDSAVLEFLGQTDDVAWGRYMTDTIPDGGYSWLSSAVEALPSDQAFIDQTILEHKKQLQLHEKQLTKLSASVKTMAAASVTMNKAVVKCAEIATNYANADMDNHDNDKGNKNPVHKSKKKKDNDKDDHKNGFKKPMNTLGSILSLWGRKSALEPAILKDVMKTCIEYELLNVSTFNSLLHRRDQAYLDYDKLLKKHNDHNNAKESGKTETKRSRLSIVLPKSMAKQPTSIDDAILNVKTELDKQDEICKAYTGALFNTEIKNFDNDRASQFKLIVSMVGVGMMKAQSEVAIAWDESTKDINTEIISKKMLKLIPDFNDYNKKHGNEEEEDDNEGREDDGTD